LDRFAHQSIWGVIAILILILCSERRVVDSTLRKVDWNASEESPPSLAVISLQLSSTETHFRKVLPSADCQMACPAKVRRYSSALEADRQLKSGKKSSSAPSGEVEFHAPGECYTHRVPYLPYHPLFDITAHGEKTFPLRDPNLLSYLFI